MLAANDDDESEMSSVYDEPPKGRASKSMSASKRAKKSPVPARKAIKKARDSGIESSSEEEAETIEEPRRTEEVSTACLRLRKVVSVRDVVPRETDRNPPS